MICVSVGEKSVWETWNELAGVEFAEIRMDNILRLDANGVRKLFSLSKKGNRGNGKKLVATCRVGAGLNEGKRKELLLAAIEAGAAYVDLELEMEEGARKELMDRAKKKECKVIVSFHNFERTPSLEELREIVEKCFGCGADIAKIACMANSDNDNARLLGLLDDKRGLIVIGMGDKGKITRIVAPMLGAEFTFASSVGKNGTAPGQMDAATIKGAIKMLNAEIKAD